MTDSFPDFTRLSRGLRAMKYDFAKPHTVLKKADGGALHKDARGIMTDGYSVNRQGSCMLGAIDLATADDEQAIRIQNRIRQGIIQLKGLDPEGSEAIWITIPGFNDANETTIEDVQLALKYARSSE